MLSGRPKSEFRWICLAALILLGPFHQAIACALDVEQIHWGFDGQVVEHRFNLLSVLVANRSPEPFDGPVTLRKSIQTKSVDAPLVENVYLAPQSSRWVQFYPYSKDSWEEWTIQWGSRSPGKSDLPKPRPGKPGCILLEEADTIPQSGGAVKRFPENLFPVSLTATDGLASVVIDHIPRWDEARERAFLDWLQHGGHVHLIRTPRGEFPSFGGALKSLNTSGFRQRVGAGYVFRHERDRRQLDPGYVEKIIIPGKDPADVADSLVTSEGQAKADPDNTQYFSYPWNGEEPLLTTLKKMARPRHSWFVIHLLSWLYIALIFPGCRLIGRRRGGDYRWVFGALLTTIAVFSLAFLLVGRRGYGERTSLHALALVRVTPDGRQDVTQWSNAFAVDGGDYTFAHDGTGRMYSTCQDDEAVRGEITSGAEAHFIADMPPFSSRAFGHRALLPGPTISASIGAWETRIDMRTETVTLRDATTATLAPQPERVLQRLTIVKGPGFPAQYQEIQAVFGRRVYSLADSAGKLELKSEFGSMSLFLGLDQFNQFMPTFDSLEHEGTPRELYAALFRPLAARAFNITSHREALDFALPEDRVRLLIYAPMPPELFARNDRFTSQQGQVLYCLDLFPPEQ